MNPNPFASLNHFTVPLGIEHSSAPDRRRSPAPDLSQTGPADQCRGRPESRGRQPRTGEYATPMGRKPRAAPWTGIKGVEAARFVARSTGCQDGSRGWSTAALPPGCSAISVAKGLASCASGGNHGQEQELVYVAGRSGGGLHLHCLWPGRRFERKRRERGGG